jgi:hypothetical protein
MLSGVTITSFHSFLFLSVSSSNVMNSQLASRLVGQNLNSPKEHERARKSMKEHERARKSTKEPERARRSSKELKGGQRSLKDLKGALGSLQELSGSLSWLIAHYQPIPPYYAPQKSPKTPRKGMFHKIEYREFLFISNVAVKKRNIFFKYHFALNLTLWLLQRF